MKKDFEKNDFVLELIDIKKHFGGVRALDGVEFKLRKGETVILLGDNGAGKSTLIKIIAGVYTPDEGEIYIRGQKIDKLNPRMARENYGIESVYQDLALFDLLDITVNLFIGKEIRWGPFLNKKKMDKLAMESLNKTGILLGGNLRQQVGQLSGGQQHAIAICRAVYTTGIATKKIVLMDEPTAGLGVKESDKLLDIVKNLKKDGHSVIFITHTLEHAFKVADRYVVFRGGKKVGERLRGKTDSRDLVHMMVG